MSSQGAIYLNTYDSTIMIYDTKTILCTLGLHITQRKLESPGKQNAVDSYGIKKLLHYHTCAMRAYF